MKVALHKTIATQGRDGKGLIHGSGLVLGLCLAGNRNPTTICQTSELGLNEIMCVKTL